jgi:hypothetical protein
MARAKCVRNAVVLALSRHYLWPAKWQQRALPLKHERGGVQLLPAERVSPA